MSRYQRRRLTGRAMRLANSAHPMRAMGRRLAHDVCMSLRTAWSNAPRDARCLVVLLALAAGTSIIAEAPGVGLLDNPADAARGYRSMAIAGLSLLLAWRCLARRRWAWIALILLILASAQTSVQALASRQSINGHLDTLGHIWSLLLCCSALFLLYRLWVQSWPLPWYAFPARPLLSRMNPSSGTPPREPAAPSRLTNEAGASGDRSYAEVQRASRPSHEPVPRLLPRTHTPLGSLPTGAALRLLMQRGASVKDLAARYGVTVDLVQTKVNQVENDRHT